MYTAIQSNDELLKAVKRPTEPIIYYSMEVIDDLLQQVHNNNGNNKEYYTERQKIINVKLRYSRTQLTDLISTKVGEIEGYRDCLSVADHISNNLGPWCCDRLWKIMLEGAHKYGFFEATQYYNPRKLSSIDVQLM